MLEMNTQDQSNADHVFELIVDKIKVGQIRVYRNLVGQAYVYGDIANEKDQPVIPAIHLNVIDKDMRGWLTLFAWERLRILLKEREIDRIIQALVGMSMRDKTVRITDPELLRVIEAEPVVAVVLEYLHGRKQKKHEFGMEALWRELKKFAKGRRLLVRGKNRFPGGPNVLSRKLALHSEVLSKLGIVITLKRSNGGKAILERLDDSQSESSTQSSAPKSPSANDLAGKDDKAATVARLAARRQSTTHLTQGDSEHEAPSEPNV